tara:strand:- start:96 stop:620 length:525 start_codon:yes stop_codon:yes gene_type:complete
MAQGASKGRPKKERPQLALAPTEFEDDEELGLTSMQVAFVWHYTEGACGQTEAARRAGFSFPAVAASKMLNGKDVPKVTTAVRMKQDELKAKYAITPEKTGSFLWKVAEESFNSGHYASAVAAIKELNQMAGISVHRSQSLNINANIDTMDRNEIKGRLRALLGDQTEYLAKDR